MPTQPLPSADSRAAIILCGGKSSRMGQPKHLLPIGDRSLLDHVITSVSQVTPKIILVAAADIELPPLAHHCTIVRDSVPHEGPLCGFREGLQACPESVEYVFLTGCDYPKLNPRLISALFETIKDKDVALPRDSQYSYPLIAVYRTALKTRVDEMIARGERRLMKLVENSQNQILDLPEVQAVDPEFESFQNLNTLADYEALISKME